jgi:hypothetical protein
MQDHDRKLYRKHSCRSILFTEKSTYYIYPLTSIERSDFNKNNRYFKKFLVYRLVITLSRIAIIDNCKYIVSDIALKVQIIFISVIKAIEKNGE